MTDSPVLKRVIGTSAWQLLDRTLRVTVALIVGIWIARYLGSSGFGRLNFAIAFVALFSFVADLGLQAIVVRELVRRPEARATIVASAVLLRLAGACFAIPLSVVFIRLVRPGDAESLLLVLVIALALLPQAWDAIDFDYQARMHPRPIIAIRGASLAVASVLRIALIVAGASLLSFGWAIPAEAALAAALMWLLCAARGAPVRFADASAAEMKSLLRDCWPFAIASLSVMLYMRLDQVMLGRMLDDHAVGIFSAAVRISEAWYFIPMAVLAAVAPILTAESGDAASYERKLVWFMRTMFLLSLVIAITFTLTSTYLIRFLYGPAYDGAAPILAVHAWSGVFASLGVATGPWFVNGGMLRFKMIHTLAGAALNLAANLWAIPRFGVMGAAASTLLSQCFAAVLFNALARRTWPVFLLQMKAVSLRKV